MILNPKRISIPENIADRLFLTADPHFGHENAALLCGRPFAGLEEMRETLVENWNSTVPKKGIVIVLGDMFWKKRKMEEHFSIMRRLNGTKHLVLGNHDNLGVENYDRLGFATLSKIVELKIGDRRIMLSHCPFLEWEGYWHGTWHFYGHTHGKLRHPSPKAIDVGVDGWGFAPVSYGRLREKIVSSIRAEEL